MIGVAVVGYGYWGPNLVRNVREVDGARVTHVVDRREDRAEAAVRHPDVAVVADFATVLDDPDVHAVIVATPVSSHYPLALAALQAGRHVLIEKPIAASAAEARHLVAEAESRGLTLLVDHTFVYTGAVRKMRELVEAGELGELYYFDSTRVNLGLFQSDVNVMWDLAVHDLSILGFVTGEEPVAVSAMAMSNIDGQPENIAYLTLLFESSLVAHINVNWLAPLKVRRTLLSGSRRMVVFDDVVPGEPLKVYDRGVDLVVDNADRYDLLVNYRSGDVWSPRIDPSEALKVEMSHFVGCIRGEEAPITGGAAGVAVVDILEAATESARRKGSLVELSRTGALLG